MTFMMVRRASGIPIYAQVEAQTSASARSLQVLASGSVSQVLPAFVGLTLYHWGERFI